MRFIKPTALAAANLGANEAFFVELWYAMTHEKSLDSYRVRCMNSRMLLRELSEELAIRLIKPSDLIGLSNETNECLVADPIINKYFSNHLKIIQPFLVDPFHGEKDDKKRREFLERGKGKEFKFIANDLYAALDKMYWEHLRSTLIETVVSGDKDLLSIVMSNTIADLIDRSWPIESIFSWHDHFIKKNGYSFKKNIEFMLKIFSQKSQQFEVTLRLTGSDKLASLGGFGDFVFAPIFENVGKTAPKKWSGGTLVCFAQTNVFDSDFLSAAINAKESFEQFIDLLRFDYEPYLLKVDPICHVKRLSDEKIDLPFVKTTIPNPTYDSDHSNFTSFVDGLKALSSKNSIDESSLRRIRGAIRQYRFGRDSENYKDKFLNWWMGLEAVANVGGDSIGDNVAFNISRLMVLPYLSRILGDALASIKYISIDWHPDLKNHCQGRELNDITLEDLFSIIQSEHHKDLLLTECTRTPTMHYRCEKLFTALTDPAKVLQRTVTHMQHLEWQLARLYRIRCCIVHGSDVRFRLNLFAANLEFYLKETIKYLITRLNSNDHIRNLDEVFSRASVTYTRTIEGLNSQGKGPQDVRNAVFANIVV